MFGDGRVRVDALAARPSQHARRLHGFLAVLVSIAFVSSISACAGGNRPPSAVPQQAPSSTSATPRASSSSPPTPAEPAESARNNGKKGPLGLPGSWKLDWHDEFSGRTVNLNRWRPNWLANSDGAITKPINRAELACYDPDNARVKNGTLRLKAQKRPCTTHDGRTYAYTSAAVESAHDYTFTYGFAEARIYLPPSDGTLAPAGSCGPNWGVFLLNGRHHPEDGEIDIMECLSGNDVSWHYHYGTEADPQVGSGYPENWQGDMPGTSGWHTFGVDWTPDRLAFYFDGVPVGLQQTGVTRKPHYLILALAISGEQIKVPQTMQVDYVRVWKRKPGSKPITGGGTVG